ncbi:hypothetical protein LCGC14_0957790 [marine sediment metagenome]|uniref:Uncharacterized protein n=1 Tax=marine sediment metagenome TaxID=412755 RepID=A0A0F9QYN9_9ZZZZ|nr:hypothetical protein [bacterium]
MSKKRFKERFIGREFWRSLNRAIILAVYSVLIFGFMLFPMYLGWILLGLAVTIPSYAALFINYLRNVESERKGEEVIGGWVEHYHKVGERYEIPVADIQPVERLSETDLKALDNYVDDIMEKAKQGKKEPQLQLTYEEEKEEVKLLKKEREDREKYDKETGNISFEHGKLTDDFKKWVEQKELESTEDSVSNAIIEQKGELADEKETD